MSRRAIAIFLGSTLLGWPAIHAEAQQPAIPTLAVLDLRDGGSIGPEAPGLRTLGTGIAMMLTTEMMRNPRVEMVERDRVRDLIEEQKLSLSGLAETTSAVRIGELVGAQYMLFGTYTDVQSILRIDVRVVEVRTGRVRRSQAISAPRDDLFQTITQLADSLFRDLELQPSAPPVATRPVPASAVLLFSQGVALEDGNEIERAREMYRRALEAAPGFTNARERLDRLDAAR